MNWLSPDKTDLIQIKNEVSPNIKFFNQIKEFHGLVIQEFMQYQKFIKSYWNWKNNNFC